MPDRSAGAQDSLARAVSALSTALPEWDGSALADVLWLASRMAGDVAEDTVAPAEAEPDEQPPVAAPERSPEQEILPAAVGERDQQDRQPRTCEQIPDDVAEVPRVAIPSPELGVARALRPWKRQWSRGRRSVWDVDATVEGYARSGELIPAFGPAPERWFSLVLVVDRSPAMRMWRETVTHLTATLDCLGAFRTLQVRELDFGEEGPELHDRLGRLTGPDQLRPSDGRRLVLVVSDCAAPGWRQPGVWQLLHAWSRSTAVALLNPLPQKLWRRTALDLPTVRVSAEAPGSANAHLVLATPVPLLPDGTDGRVGDGGDQRETSRIGGGSNWQPLPVLSLSRRALDRWSRAVMRTDPEGCAAVLVPRTGRIPTPLRTRSIAPTVSGFLHTASPAAARLAVLCSPFDRLGTPLLQLIRQGLVPEAAPPDVAELLVSGLLAAEPGENGAFELTLPHGVRRELRSELTEHDLWQLNRVLTHALASEVRQGGDLSAAVPASEHRALLQAGSAPLERAERLTLELLGMSRGDSTREADRETAPETDYARGLPTYGSPGVDNRPYFYLSYAHTPTWGDGVGDPDHWVHQLFSDLCDHIMALTDLPAGAPAGFMDRELRSGDGWSEKLSENLATCRVFVPLFSPRYFASESCGREWFAFNERVVRARSSGSPGRSAIVPALWTRMDYSQLPDSVRHIHVDQAQFGDRYAADGIYGLIKLNRLRDEYEEAVLGLAQRIVRVAHESPLPPGRPRPYESTPSAFKPRGHGPRSIHLTVAAPSRDQLPVDRDVRPYGESAHDWNPYHSESVRPLPALAEELIRSMDYRITVSAFDDEDVEGGDSKSPGTPCIVLIDRWALTDDDRRRRLVAFDSGASPWVGAVAPWSRADRQSNSVEGRRLGVELSRTMPGVLDRSRHGSDRSAVTATPTLQSFMELLPHLVAHLTRQYLMHAQVTPAPGPPYPRPRLMGPSSPRWPEMGPEDPERL
ncbi:TIR-like protein FxsC [Streptomyces siamensis]|uniref:TIR domain-containing protein n=1 Tax=Streptomyces siamensis TaxID=1274986 RepID=A0ABP9JRU7_9ACTN